MIKKLLTISVIFLSLSIIILMFQRCKSTEPISKVELGKLIFFDNTLSEPPGQSCATCHRPEKGFADTLSRDISEGAVKGLFNKRNSMTIAYTAQIPPLSKIVDDEDTLYIGGLFWDGRADSLAHQAGMPFLDKLEMANENEEMVVMKFIKTPYYKEFCKIYGTPNFEAANKESEVLKVFSQIVNALSAYQASDEVCPYSSKFDMYLSGNYKFTAEEELGFELFKDKAMCAECHILDPDASAGKVLFTDHTYDNLGLPKNPDNKFYFLDTQHNPRGVDYIDEGLKLTTGAEGDLGKFRVPTLRNIELTAPYGHNGYFKTLAEIVNFYNVRDVSDKYPAAECPATVNKDELGNLKLNEQEESALVTFLKTLTDIR